MTVSRYYRADSVKTYLNALVETGHTQIAINSIANFPTSYPFTIIVNRDLSNEEVMQVDSLVSTAGDVTTYAVTRGSSVEPTVTAKEHNAGSTVEHGVSARDFRESREHENATSGVHGVTGSVVGTSDSQTLTNKSLSTGCVVPQSVVTNLTSDLAGKASTSHTHTLSNVTDVTASAAEVNILDGVTATTAELNILDGVTATAAELNLLDGVTATTAELNILDGVTATTAELNILDGVTANKDELNFVDGVTSNIQTQLDAKLATPGAWTSYTPTIGGGWTAGNSTVTAAYQQIGKTVHVRVSVAWGTTYTSSGTNSPTFTLPVTAASSNASQSGILFCEDGTTRYMSAVVITSTTVATGYRMISGSAGGLGNITATAPFTWSTGDAIRFNLTYEAA